MTQRSKKEKAVTFKRNVKVGTTGLNIINAILFQIIWFVCVTTTDVVSSISVLILLIIHSLFMVRDTREWWLITGFTLIGIVIDSVLQSFGLIQFSGAILWNDSISVIPIWMMCLWLAFSTTLVHGLFWLHGRWKLALLVGLFAVPVSYYGGLFLSDSSSIEPMWIMLVAIGLIWSALLPTGLFIAEKYGLLSVNTV
ncbi:DUF2878 domain-containing protein [Marinomonas sp. 2405UD68-3]|uniref:DUF2878 domain-containing protein n=1 Tax=Marinomonas sp. 2405UD68-3 TaxID=3391835 RepID=UPI0039C8FAE2